MALNPRDSELLVTENSDISENRAKALSIAADNLWKYAKNRDKKGLGKAMIQSYEAQIAMFPNMVTEEVQQVIKNLPTSVLGYKLSGAGGGGYLVLFSEKEIPNTLKIRIRRAQ
jgi:galactokinase/mevalonate kinase-like predicted kinase